MSRFVSYLVRPGPLHLTAGEILARMCSLYPQAAGSFGPTEPVEAGPSPTIVSVRVGEQVVVVEPVAVPLPAAAFSAAAAADSYWPDAEAALASGATYTVVSLRNAVTGHAAAIQGALAVTMVLCALASVGRAIGAVWSLGATVANLNTLARVAEMVADGELPALFWVSMRFDAGLGDGGERTTMASTMGLAPFVDREIEFLPAAMDRPTLELLLRFLCATIIRDGHVLLDRETYVLSDTESLRVAFGSSGVGRGAKVIKLIYVREVPPARAATKKPSTAGKRPVFGRRGGTSAVS